MNTPVPVLSVIEKWDFIPDSRKYAFEEIKLRSALSYATIPTISSQIIRVNNIKEEGESCVMPGRGNRPIPIVSIEDPYGAIG